MWCIAMHNYIILYAFPVTSRFKPKYCKPFRSGYWGFKHFYFHTLHIHVLAFIALVWIVFYIVFTHSHLRYTQWVFRRVSSHHVDRRADQDDNMWPADASVWLSARGQGGACGEVCWELCHGATGGPNEEGWCDRPNVSESDERTEDSN